MRLSDYAQGRDNNFNLIRIIAAMAVLVTHSFALAIGSADAEPFRDTLGMTMGSMAVDFFFVASGFLVTSSLLSRQNIVEFVWARALRIFPALWTMLLLTVLLAGLFFTSLSATAYFSSPTVFAYVLKCSTLLFGIAYELPGVFEGNPYKHAVNGSLWTMPFEVRMYAILVLMWVGLRLVRKVRLLGFKAGVVALAVVASFWLLAERFHLHTGNPFPRLLFMFFVGAVFCVFKNRVVLSHWLFGALAAALLISSANKDVFYVIYVFSLAYILFYLAYVPAGFVRGYNKFGDYSYGVYIYAFPVQQTIAALVPGVSVVELLLMSALVTLLLAALSWHLIEKRALKLKDFYVGSTSKLFARSKIFTT